MMNLLEIVKEWLGVLSLLLTGVVWWFVKLNSDKIKANESAKQEVERTEQERLATEEKELDLDARKVKESESVASEALVHLAETREENLGLLEDKYNLRKEVLSLSCKVKDLEDKLSFLNEYVCFSTECCMRIKMPQQKCLNNGKDA